MHDRTKELLAGPNFAVLTTLMADGGPQSHVMWVGGDDDHLHINTQVDRQKYRNVVRDPRVAVTIIDAGDPYSFVEVRGTVVDMQAGEVGLAHIHELSHRYRGKPYDESVITADRVKLTIRVDREFVR